jgi:hypothetical protein
MMTSLALLVAVAVSLLGPYLGVQAAGRQLLATTNTSGIYYGEQQAFKMADSHTHRVALGALGAVLLVYC